MRKPYTTLAAILALALSTLATAAGAAVLWDQSTIDPNGPGIVGSYSPGFGGFVAHTVNDITVPAEGWHVTSITQYYAGFNYAWTNLTLGYVNIQPKSGALPTAAVSAVQVPMSCVISGDYQGQPIFAVTAALNLDLVPGSYWVGLTPIAPAGLDGANLMWATTTIGSPVATFLSPGPWDVFYGDYDSTFRVEGDVNAPVPTAATTWGRLKAMYH
jgi:hypothetical protein